jgi:hypothetical protein
VGVLLGGGDFVNSNVNGTAQPQAWRQVFIPIDPTFFAAAAGVAGGVAEVVVGLYKLNSVQPWLARAWFQPLQLTCDILALEYIYKSTLYRYVAVDDRVWNRIIWRDVSGAGAELQLRDVSLESYVRVVDKGDASAQGDGSLEDAPSSWTAGASSITAPAAPPAPRKALADLQIEQQAALLAMLGGVGVGGSNTAPPAPAVGSGETPGYNLGLIVIVFMAAMVGLYTLDPVYP